MRHFPPHAGIIRLVCVLAALVISAGLAYAQHDEEGGWLIKPTHYRFVDLVTRLDDAVKAHQMTLVNFASASEGAKAQGIAILGNRVVGVFRNDFARRLLALNLRAGIEAPIRFYLTEDAGGTATLSYRSPSTVFAPYLSQSPPELKGLAKELDGIFAAIAAEATGQ